MMAESVLCALIWYSLVGWCSADLHRYTGCFSRYSGAKYWISWAVMFLCWPAALPLYVDSVRQLSKGDVDDD